MSKFYLHVDLDAFFASVEQLDNPSYRGKPVIVGGEIGDKRAVVSTASYEARRFGIHSAMPLEKAVQLCPHGIFLRGNMQRYHEKSQQVMNIFREYSPDVVQMSVDEAFIDLTGTELLFGNPLDTARKIKERIRNETGLTVSIGIASTKYIAKIASGFRKPDGFYYVPEGKETQFMLSLPLNKVWGIGESTLKKLNSAGIKTTKDIYDRSQGLLQSLFGQASSYFLYQAVRGGDNSFFDTPAKSHQISSETTYVYDLYTPDAIDTALLELCHTVMFRLHKEKLRSKSVTLKIRFDDFTTVSVQETSDRYVLSIDDLFERARRLFYKKSDGKKGIRLLGVGLQNIEDSSLPVQKELFSSVDEKKKKLEEAIIKAESKNPDIKITRARLLKDNGKLKAILPFIAGILLFCNAKAQAQQSVNDEMVFDTTYLPLEYESPGVNLFENNNEKHSTQFFARGYWHSSVKQEAQYSFGFGTEKTFSTSSPVFIQDVNLNLLFTVDNHWYFETVFADEFETNTFTMGYRGDSTLKEAKISNRNIIFPPFYSIEEIGKGISGGSNQSPGISLSFENNKIKADTVLRYDMLKSFDKTWYGKNSVSDENIELYNYLTGIQYVLPDEELINNVKNIYVESRNGTYTDKNGRKFNKLNKSQYLLQSSDCMIYLSRDACASVSENRVCTVAVSFYSDTGPLSSYLGSYKTSDGSNGEGFLGDVQKLFNGINIGQYSYGRLKNNTPSPDKTGTEIQGFFGEINEEQILYIQHPAGFSPFISASRYDLGLSEAEDTFIASKNTEVRNTQYASVITDDDTYTLSSDFFVSGHTYADIYKTDETILKPTDPLYRFPLAAIDPYIYLSHTSDTDYVLRVRKYEKDSSFDIGTKAVKGSVCVYKNGIQDDNAVYSQQTGYITLSTNVKDSDHIYVTWYEESEDSSSAAVSSSAGIQWSINNCINTDLSYAARWPADSTNYYTDNSTSSPGYVAAASKLQYNNGPFNILNISSISYDQPDTTGIYRVLSMDDAESETVYLSETAGTNLPQLFTPSLNERFNTHSSSKYPELDSEYNRSKNISGGKKDSETSGYTVNIEADFFKNEDNPSQIQWCAASIDLGSGSSSLRNAQSFTIALKSSNPDITLYDVYLQLGVDADEDFTAESITSIPTWLITASPDQTDVTSPFYPSEQGWQMVTVSLTEWDRERLLQNNDARIIITADSQINQAFTIITGPYEIQKESFILPDRQCVSLISSQETDSTLAVKKIKHLNESKNYVQVLEWKYDDIDTVSSTLTDEDDYKISMYRYFEEVPFDQYKELTMFFNINPESSQVLKNSLVSTDSSLITFKLERNSSTSDYEEAFTLSLDHKILSVIDTGRWHSLKADLNTKSVYIDGTKLNTDYYSLYIKKSVIPDRFTIVLNSLNKDTLYKSGEIKVDELLLEESYSYYTIKDKTAFSYTKEKDSASFYFMSQNLYATTIYEDKDKNNTQSVSTSSQTGFTYHKLKTGFEINLSSEEDNIITGSSHNIETTDLFFNLIGFEENYNYDYVNEYSAKDNTLKLDFHSVSVPLYLEAQSKSDKSQNSVNQLNNYTLLLEAVPISINNSLFYSQKLPAKNYDTDLKSNYKDEWISLSDIQLSAGKEEAQKRSIGDTLKLSADVKRINVKPVVEAATQGTYKNSWSTLYTDKTYIKYLIPWSHNRNNYSLSYKKTMGGQFYTDKTNLYYNDINTLTDTYSSRKWFIESFPINDLFSDRLARDVLKDSNLTESSTQNLYYIANYTTSWSHGLYGNLNDLFIPSGVTFEIERDIKTASSISDIYQLKLTTHYDAVNLFGKTGCKPLFDFYNQDEYVSSFGMTIKAPKQTLSDPKMCYTMYLQMKFMKDTKNYVRTSIEGIWEDSEEWSGKYSLGCKRAAYTSIVTGFADLFTKDKSQQTLYKIDKLIIKASDSVQSDKVLKKRGFDYIHGTEVSINKYASINTDIQFNYSMTWNKAVTTGASATAGCTIKF